MVLKFKEYINESLWKKSIERSKTGEKRIEDKQPIDYICDFLNKILSRFFEKSELVCEWKECNSYNKDKIKYLITIYFNKFDSKYPSFQFEVYSKVGRNNIPDLFVDFNNGFIHGKEVVDTEHFTPESIIKKYKILNDDEIFTFISCVFQTKLEYTHKFKDLGGGRGFYSHVGHEDVDVESLLDINKDIKQLPDGRYVFNIINNYGKKIYITPPTL